MKGRNDGIFGRTENRLWSFIFCDFKGGLSFEEGFFFFLGLWISRPSYVFDIRMRNGIRRRKKQASLHYTNVQSRVVVVVKKYVRFFSTKYNTCEY